MFNPSCSVLVACPPLSQERLGRLDDDDLVYRLR
jgi:hypothetical protein